MANKSKPRGISSRGKRIYLRLNGKFVPFGYWDGDKVIQDTVFGDHDSYHTYRYTGVRKFDGKGNWVEVE